MPTLHVRVPGEDPRAVPVAGPVLVGRAEDCQVQVTEKRASRHHLRIAPAGDPEGGGWIVEDLDSSNGTLLGEERVLRRLLKDGDVLRVGDTELGWEAPLAPLAPLVGGRLTLSSVPAAGPREPGPVEPGPVDAGPVDAGPLDPGTRPLDMRTFGRALGLAVIALLALAGVHLLLGGKARKAEQETEARRQLSALLARADLDAAVFEAEARHYLQAFPQAPDRALLERHLEAVSTRARVRQGVEARFQALMSRLGSLPEDQVRIGLLALKRELAEDQGLAERVRLAFVELDRRRAALERAEGERVRAEARELLTQGLPGPALFRLSAWRAGRGSLAPEEAERLTQAQEEALAAVRSLAAQTQAAAEAEKDPERRRRLLAAAWPALAGTAEQEPLADALRYLSRPQRPSGGPSGVPGTGPDPSAAAQALLARAAEAERLFGASRWAEAAKAFDALVAEAQPGPLKSEWTVRRGDVERVLGLVDALAAQAVAAGEKPLRVQTPSGPWVVKAADRAQVVREREGEARPSAWAELPPEDVWALLTPAKPDPEQRQALAVLAAALGKPEQLVAVLAPLYEKGAPGALVDALVARLLDGRSEAPPGGYHLHKGRLLDATAHGAALEAERLDALALRAQELLARLAKEPVLKKLERMRELRAELDRRRMHALVAIFNEKHYPYPADKGRPPYTLVQGEIDRRIAAVREIWEGDDGVKLSRTGTAGKLVEEVEAAVADLASKGRDVDALRAALEQVAPYMTGETLRIKDFCLDEAERKALAYNRWVMGVHNPGRTGTAVSQEVEQVAVTNAYRMMLGYMVAVTPGDAAYEAIDDTNVAKVLDQGRVVPGSIVPLKAVRIDDRLILSARLHSQDMGKRGFFDHFAPPNPATGAPRTSPFDRMRTAGYEGHGASENICAGAGDPTSAHNMWCHSSGHHRNILSAWADMGTGVSGTFWTQNFGTGGGRPTVIDAPTAPVAPRR